MRSKQERSEAILDKLFTKAWRNSKGLSIDTPAGRDFVRIGVDQCYGDAWSREGQFDLKTRSLITLTVLVTLGATEELTLHIDGALRLGHEPDDLIELFIQIQPYAGTPRAHHAMSCLEQVLAKKKGAA